MSAFTSRPKRVLIASANPLFREGLRKVYMERWGKGAVLLGTPATMEETLAALETLRPDLVIVDHDDKSINRGEFLNRFMAGHSTMKVVLVSLDEAGKVVVYDRRQLSPAQAERWLSDPWGEENLFEQHQSKSRSRMERRKGMRHFIINVILIVVCTLLVYSVVNDRTLLPPAAAAQARTIDELFTVQWIAMSFLFSLIVVPLFYSLVVFRRKKGDDTDARHMEGNTTLEVAWTILPLIAVIGLAFLGGQSLAATRRADPQAMEVKVTAFQWAWKFGYPGYGNVTTDKLYLSVDKQVVLRMNSLDVIHSFWVPEFRLKQDLVPGEETSLRITPDKLGEYKVRCAELCGTSHSYMETPVIVMSAEEFDKTLKQLQAEAEAAEASGIPDAGRGEEIYQSFGCRACHTTDGSPLIGPTWRGLYGSTVTLSDGSKVTVDDAYLTQSIRDPNSQVVAGFAPGMPTLPLTDLQVKDVIEYIKTLK
jgi:cytochrome c oxidase subunit II